MTKIKISTLLALFIILSSCDNKSLELDTETYQIEMKKASKFHRNFTNLTQESPLYIKAERLSLKDILSILIKTDTTNIKFENKKLENEHYSVLIKQKDKNHPINKIVLNELLNDLNLTLDVDTFKSFKISIKDTVQYSKFINTSNDNTSYVFESNDSVKIKNCDLKKLTEILNSEFQEEIILDNNYRKINYSWKKTSFEKFRQNLNKDLGLLLLDNRNDRTIFKIKNN